MICDRCGGIFKYNTKTHRTACKRTPTPEELIEEWEFDRTATCQSLADKYHVTGPFVRDRMRLTGLSKQELGDRGRTLRRKNNKKSKTVTRQVRERWKPAIPPQMKICKCGVLIPSSANKCVFCRLDDSGVHNVYQLVGEAAITALGHTGD